MLPAESDVASGGNVYNRELVRALRELTPVETTTFAEAERMLRAGKPGLYLFDSLDLLRTTTLPASRPGQHVGLVVHHLPSLEPELPPDHPSREAESAALRRFDLFLATSDFTRSYLARAEGCSTTPILLVPPAPGTRPAGARTYASPLWVLMVSNLIPRKGILPLLSALAALGDAPYSLRLVGSTDLDPSYADACRRVATEAKSLSTRVSLVGPVPHEEIGRYYETSHLFVSSARMETFGMAMLDARVHGLPILALDGGYSRHHFTDGENGRLFFDAKELAQEVLELARSPARMEKLFAAAQRLRAGGDYTWSAAANRFLTALAQAGLPDRR